jgi:uncharacterized membrane protein
MLFKRKKRIDLGMVDNFEIFKKHNPIRRLYEFIGTLITEVLAGANIGTALGVGVMSLGNWFTIISAVVSIGWTIYNAVASKDKARSGGASNPNAIDSNGQLVNTRQSSDPLRVLYGIVKTGGTWCYTKFSSTSNNIINIVVTWGEGEISGLGTGIDSSLIYSGSTLDDLETKGEFVYAGCSCDMACDGYVPCSCNMACHVY